MTAQDRKIVSPCLLLLLICLSLLLASSLVKIKVFTNKRQELLQTLAALENSACQPESGCLEFRFYQEEGNKNAILLVMAWQTQEGLKAYQDSDSFRILKGAISLL